MPVTSGTENLKKNFPRSKAFPKPGHGPVLGTDTWTVASSLSLDIRVRPWPKENAAFSRGRRYSLNGRPNPGIGRLAVAFLDISVPMANTAALYG